MRSVLTRPIGNSLLDGRYVAQDCVTIGVGNNRPWRSAEHGEGGGRGNDRRLIRIRGKLFEFSIDGSAWNIIMLVSFGDNFGVMSDRLFTR